MNSDSEGEWLSIARRVACSMEQGITLLQSLVGEVSSSPHDDTLDVDDVTSASARAVLRTSPELLRRDEAAKYTRRSPRIFDRTIRPYIRNVGTKRRLQYTRTEIDKCLEEHPHNGPSAHVPGASTSTSVSPTRVSVSRNRRAQTTLKLLRGSRRSSTPKS